MNPLDEPMGPPDNARSAVDRTAADRHPDDDRADLLSATEPSSSAVAAATGDELPTETAGEVIGGGFFVVPGARPPDGRR